MRIFAAAALCFVVVTSAQAAQTATSQASDPAAAPPVKSTVDSAKQADIQRLMDVVGSATMIQQLLSGMEQNLKPTLAKSLPPGEYRERLIDLFFEKFRSKFDTNQLLKLVAARYDENFTDQDIQELIAFYQTPLGRKLITVLPKVMLEAQQDGQKLGEQAGRDSMREVLAEHPDLAQALQQAARAVAAPR